MRKRIFIAGYVCLISIGIQAQEKVNVIKANLSALTFRNISLQYEVKEGKKTSVAFSINTIPYGKLPFQKSFQKLVDNPNVQHDSVKMGRLGIVGELRFYLGKKGNFNGFYFGPFLGYTNHKMLLPLTYSSKVANFEGRINVLNAGLQLGAQTKLWKNLFLDFWILGPNIGSAYGELHFSALPNSLTIQEQKEFTNIIERLKNDTPFRIIKNTRMGEYSSYVGEKDVRIAAKGSWGGLRAGGICLGINF